MHYDNNSSQQLRLEELPNDSVHTIHVQLPPEFQWKNTSLSLVYWNLGGNSPLSNTVQVPGITSGGAVNRQLLLICLSKYMSYE